MKKRKFLTAACMFLTIITSSLQAKTVKKKDSKSDNNKKEKTVKPHKKSTVSKKTLSNNGIYSIPSHNRTSLLETKMTELRKKHSRIAVSGSPIEKKQANVEKKLLTFFSKWKGTRYAWGGDSRRGIDCSALTRRAYREVFGYELPRVSTQQVKEGKKIAIKNLKPGDIIFFKPEGRTNHTAVYVGNSLFINASSSKGVVLSSLKSPYWAKYVKYGVRVNT